MKKIVKGLVELLGYEISRKQPAYSTEAVLRNTFGDGRSLLVFDVGAHHGEAARRYVRIFRNCRVFSFEPSPESFTELLSVNSDQITAFDFGFSDRDGTATFHTNKTTATSSMFSLAEDAQSSWGVQGLQTQQIIQCHFRSLDSFVAEKNIEQIDLLKLDVQGAEFKVLDGAQDTLGCGRVSVIQIELINQLTYVGQKSVGYYLNRLESLGFKLHALTEPMFGSSGQLLQVDAILRHSSFGDTSRGGLRRPKAS
jgi:FkbM family methyltransferase